MFENLKVQIRKEIGNKTVKDLNDDVAKELETIAEKAKEEKNFEKVIACHEIIVYDLGLENTNAFGAKTNLLAEYSDCGYINTKAAFELVMNLLNEGAASDASNSILPQIHLPAIYALYQSKDNDYKQLAIQYAESAVDVSRNVIEKFGINDFNTSFFMHSIRALMRLHIKQGKYADANDLFFSIIHSGFKAVDADPIARVLYSVIDTYGLSDLGDEYSDKAVESLKYYSDAVPEASYILGIMSAEGYKIPKDINAAKRYFEEGDELVEILRGRVGYTDFEFSVLSDISKEEIIKRAETGEYHSKFFNARKKASSNSSNSNTSTTGNSLGGCYVATCVYGSYDCPEVWTLRRFRDNILAKNVFGRLFIKLYYAVSPTAVRLFGKYRWFHKIFKAPLDSLVEKLINNGVENTPYND